MAAANSSLPCYDFLHISSCMHHKQGYRFQLQTDRFALQRVSALLDALRELKRVDPSVISISLFGSLSKGCSKFASDIDAFLFVRASAQDKRKRINERSYRLIYGEGVWENVGIKTRCAALLPEADERCTSLFRSMVRDQVPTLTMEQLRHLQVMPISEEIIEALIDDIISGSDPKGRYFSEVAAISPRVMTAESAPVALATAVNYPSVTLSTLFHLDLGGGLQQLRAHVFRYLLGRPMYADRTWKEIALSIEAREQKVSYGRLPTNISYPRTLCSGIELYLLDSKADIQKFHLPPPLRQPSDRVSGEFQVIVDGKDLEYP